MTPENAEKAARHLIAAGAARRREMLPPDLAPKSEADAVAICEAIHRLNTAPIAGWKIGATGEGARKALGLEMPFIGFIPADRIDEDGTRYVHKDMMRPIVESEYAFRLKKDLPARAQPYTKAEVEDAVGSLVLGIEVPESRLPDDHGLGTLGLVADHGGVGRYIVGPEFTEWKDLDRVHQDVVLTFDGKEVGRGKGEAMMGDPLDALVWFANHMSKKGIDLKAGQFVSTGSATGVILIKEPATAVADFGPLGKVTAVFA